LLVAKSERLKKPLIYAAGAIFFSILLFDVTQNIIPAASMSKSQFEKKAAALENEPECVCWWTVWAKTEALERREKILAGERAVDISRWDAEIREFTIEKGDADAEARVATFYHPHWKAAANGAPVEVRKADDGTILVPVGAEKTSVELYFEEPFKLKTALAVSIVSWCFLVGASIIAYRRRRSQTVLMTVD